MNGPADPLAYRRLRAPREDGGVLIEPASSEAGALADASVRRRETCGVDFHGLSLAALAREARRELLADSCRYTSAYLDLPFDSRRLRDAERIFVAGHQPQLFHPGVWFKNFALGAFAEKHGAIAVNLVIDSDVMRSPAIRVPGGSAAHPQAAMIALDDSGRVVPFEERSILNRELFETFGRRVSEQIGPWIPKPLVEAYWPLAVARSRETGNLGACLAQSRHQWERQWGLRTLELPQSRVCQLRSFARFTVSLLAESERLANVYNAAVRAYRRIHRIRSAAHPVPDLLVEGPWIEVPYWIWTADDPRRRRLFVSRRGCRTILSDRQGLEISLELPPAGDPRRAVEEILELSQRGVKVRSRALITTMFARLVLGDLFLHGIGGAKYDQVTDAIIQGMFAIEPPPFLTLSATILLPVPRAQVSVDDARRIQRQLRDLEHHPEAFVDTTRCVRADCEAAELIAAKKCWIATVPTPQNARTRWREIRRVNAALQPFVAERREALLRKRAAVVSALAAEAVLSWREYAFCLYPEAFLRGRLASLIEKVA